MMSTGTRGAAVGAVLLLCAAAAPTVFRVVRQVVVTAQDEYRVRALDERLGDPGFAPIHYRPAHA